MTARPGLFSCRPAGHRQCIRRDVHGDHTAGGDDGAITDRHRRDKRGIGADERARTDCCAMLVVAVVVAGDRPGADVRLGADIRVAEIRQVVRLGARAEFRCLHLDEVADMHLLAKIGAGAQPGVWPHDAVRADNAAFQVTERPDLRTGRDLYARTEYDVGFDRHVRRELGVGAQENGRRIGHGDAAVHRGCAQPRLHHRLGGREFAARVDAGEFVGRGLDRGDTPAIGTRQGDDIGEIVFPLGIVGAYLGEPARHVGGGGTQDAGVAQRLGALRCRRVDPFDDALDVAVARDHAAVACGIGGTEGEQRQRRVAGGAALEQAAQRLGSDQRVVGIQHRHFAVAEMRCGDQRGVCGAVAILLHNADVRRGLLAHGVHLRPDHHDDAVECLFAACQQVAQHGAAGDLVQRLGQRRLHARAEAGCQDHGGAYHHCPLLHWRSCGGTGYAVSKPTTILVVQFQYRSATP